MARRTRAARPMTGLFHARQARGMSRSELVRLSGVSKQQLSRLETGLIRLRLDHLAPFAGPLGYTPEQILLWGRYPGTPNQIETDEASGNEPPAALFPGHVPELDTHASHGGRDISARDVRKDGRYTDALKNE